MKIKLFLITALFFVLNVFAQNAEQTVSRMLSEQETAWNKNDMKAFCKDFTDDSVLINFLGMYWEGKENILAEFAKINDCCIKPSSVKFELIKVKEISADVMVAYAKETITAKEDYTVPGKIVKKGTVDVKMMTLILVKENNAWKFKSGQLTLLAPMPKN